MKGEQERKEKCISLLNTEIFSTESLRSGVHVLPVAFVSVILVNRAIFTDDL